MKNIINKIAALTFVLLGTVACELTQDLDDYEPQNVLPAGEAANDQESAELLLVSVYSGLLETPWVTSSSPWAQMIVSTMGISCIATSETSEWAEYTNNDPGTEGFRLSLVYGGFYNVIARANWVIFNVEQNTVAADFSPESRRAEIIAEAKGIRALYHFYALRWFGQFYDANSAYGVDVRLDPPLDGSVSERNTVAEVYAAIHEDLDDVILNAPDLRAKYYINKTFGKALKAKVHLYEGDYTNAATLAKEVIDASSADFGLAASFTELFDFSTQTPLSGQEALLNVYADPGAGQSTGAFWWGNHLSLSPTYITSATSGTMTVGGQTIDHDGARVSSVTTFDNGNGKYAGTGPYVTIYHLRMAEVYLIYAEAAAKANGSAVPAEALQRLNEIRIRAGALSTGGDGFETYPNTITYAEFLEAVRIEKLMELGAENGEDWFDLVRYDFADGFGTGFEVSDVKPSATNSDKFILPIPLASIEASNGVVVQNPSY